jgi:hypothetical protein
MIGVYAQIYQDIYDFREEKMAVTGALGSKNLAEIGVTMEALALK